MTRPEPEPPRPHGTTPRHAVALTVLLAIVIVVVRADADVCQSRFTSAGPGAILDKETGLTWTAQPHSSQDWPSANAGCKAPWRLPTALELLTLIDDSTGTIPSPFPSNSSPAGYWSSSPVGNAPSVEKFFVYSNGAVNKDIQDHQHKSRCVKP
ncbi:MAG: DUF1566 domain-containing protein [Minicystis sp.]